MIGVAINFFAVILGGIAGTLIRGGIAERFKNVIMQGLALCILVIGIMGAIGTSNILIVIISIVLGSVLGEMINIERGIEKLGDAASRAFHQKSGGFAEGFVSATLLFSVGAMAVVGSLNAGLANDGGTLIAKSALDGISSVIFASSLGAGVILSAVPMTLYQGGIALLAVWVSPLLSEEIITEMSAVGSVLIIALGLNMLGVMKDRIRVANMLPSMFVPLLYFPVYRLIMSLIG